MTNNNEFNTVYYLLIFIVICFIFAISYVASLKFQEFKKKRRKNKIKSFALKMKLISRDYYREPFKFKDELCCFGEMINPNFVDVIIKKLNDKENLFIGDLEWEPKEDSKANRNAEFLGSILLSFFQSDSNEKLKKSTTMLLLEDNNINLPSFNLIKETFSKKATELFHLNKTEDIDFEDDKNFSDAWWLFSNENILVKDLFTRSIRNSFMKFVDKGYNIIGYNHLLIIIADKLYETENYYQLMSDISEIHKILKSNNKFYQGNK